MFKQLHVYVNFDQMLNFCTHTHAHNFLTQTEYMFVYIYICCELFRFSLVRVGLLFSFCHRTVQWFFFNSLANMVQLYTPVSSLFGSYTRLHTFSLFLLELCRVVSTSTPFATIATTDCSSRLLCFFFTHSKITIMDVHCESYA